MGRRAPAQLIILSALVRSPKLRTMYIAELLTSALPSAKSPFVSTLMAGVGRAMLRPTSTLFSGASEAGVAKLTKFAERRVWVMDRGIPSEALLAEMRERQ